MSTFTRRQLFLDGLCLLVGPRAECVRRIAKILQEFKGQREKAARLRILCGSVRFVPFSLLQVSMEPVSPQIIFS